jgi:Fe(3+) dicitrate transport protein
VTVFKMRFDNQILQVPGITRRPSRTSAPPTTRAWRAPSTTSPRTALAGLELYANYTWTKAIQQSGDNRGLDVPFYSRDTDSVGARYALAGWTFNVSSTHQSGQFSDAANTWAESADARAGRVPAFACGTRRWPGRCRTG